MTSPDPRIDALMRSVRLAHGRDTCDEGGRPLSIYTCPYHEGYADGFFDGQTWEVDHDQP